MPKTLEEELAELNAQVVDAIQGRKVTRGELSKAFDTVKDAQHWKNPINAVATLRNRFEIAKLHRAVVFFTGSVPNIHPIAGKRYRVRAPGYYAAVGA